MTLATKRHIETKEFSCIFCASLWQKELSKAVDALAVDRALGHVSAGLHQLA